MQTPLSLRSLTFFGLIVAGTGSGALGQEVRINEVLAGINGNSRAQFVELTGVNQDTDESRLFLIDEAQTLSDSDLEDALLLADEGASGRCNLIVVIPAFDRRQNFDGWKLLAHDLVESQAPLHHVAGLPGVHDHSDPTGTSSQIPAHQHTRGLARSNIVDPDEVVALGPGLIGHQRHYGHALCL